jgi:hypothetical protein
MKKHLLLLLICGSLFAAPPAPIASDVRGVLVPDANNKLHNAGDIRDVVKNYPSLKTQILASAKTAIEAKASDLEINSAEVVKQEMTILKAAGGTIDASKEATVDSKITADDTVKQVRDQPK